MKVIAKNGSILSFPDNFLFGVSSSAYQIEGGSNLDGKGPSIWDEFIRLNPEKIVDLQNGDTGANSYEYYLDDIEAVKSLNVNNTYFHSYFQLIRAFNYLGQFLSIFNIMVSSSTKWPHNTSEYQRN